MKTQEEQDLKEQIRQELQAEYAEKLAVNENKRQHEVRLLELRNDYKVQALDEADQQYRKQAFKEFKNYTKRMNSRVYDPHTGQMVDNSGLSFWVWMMIIVAIFALFGADNIMSFIGYSIAGAIVALIGYAILEEIWKHRTNKKLLKQHLNMDYNQWEDAEQYRRQMLGEEEYGIISSEAKNIRSHPDLPAYEEAFRLIAEERGHNAIMKIAKTMAFGDGDSKADTQTQQAYEQYKEKASLAAQQKQEEEKTDKVEQKQAAKRARFRKLFYPALNKMSLVFVLVTMLLFYNEADELWIAVTAVGIVFPYLTILLSVAIVAVIAVVAISMA